MAFQACVWPGYGLSGLLLFMNGERLITPPSSIFYKTDALLSEV